MKRETKIYSRESQSQSEGSFWELCVFAIFFVVIFTVLARTAHAAPLSQAQRSQAQTTQAQPRTKLAKNDPNLSPKQTVAATADDDMTVNPIHLQSLPSSIPSAALPAANASTTLPEKDTTKRFVWSSSLVLDTSGTLNTEEAHSYSGEYLLKTGITDQRSNIAGILKFGYDREYSFEQEDGHDGDLVDPSIAVTKTWTEGKDFRSPVFDSIVAGLSSVVGASRESARRTFLGSVGPKLGVTKKIHRLNLGETFGYSYKFYNYDIRDDGTINSPHSISATTDLSYDITDNFAVSAETVLLYAINFQGTGVSEEWSSFSLDYTISKALGVSLGVATKRPTVSDDGTFNQVKFVDSTVAQAFFDLILNF